MPDLKAQVNLVPKTDGGREVMLSIGTQAGDLFTSVCLGPKDCTALAAALNTAAVEVDRVIVTPTGVEPS